MAKLITDRIVRDGAISREIDFKYDINITKDGIFNTTLPADISELLNGAGIRLERNRLKNLGYFTSSTIDELRSEVNSVISEYLSRELKDDKIVIQYIIQTTCAYCLDITGEIVPNGHFEFTKTEKIEWKSGTIKQSAGYRYPFGIRIYAKPFRKKTYRFRSGKEKAEYERMHVKGISDKPSYLYWLDSVCGIEKPKGENIKEIDYNEDIAKFFVDLLKSICRLNEQIKDMLEPESIKQVVEQKIKFLKGIE